MNRLDFQTHLWISFLFFFWPHCAACGMLVPQPGIEPMPPALGAQSLNHWTTREVALNFCIKEKYKQYTQDCDSFIHSSKWSNVLRALLRQLCFIWVDGAAAFLHKSFEQYCQEKFKWFKSHSQGFPGGAVVENLPANAGDMGSSPGLGRSHMPRISWAREPQLLSLRVWSLCSATREAAIVRGPRTAMKSGPPPPACRNWRKPSHRNKDPTQLKINKLIN